MQPQVGDRGPGQAEGTNWGVATPRDAAQRDIFSYCFAKSRFQEECEVFSYLMLEGYFQAAWRKLHSSALGV